MLVYIACGQWQDCMPVVEKGSWKGRHNEKEQGCGQIWRSRVGLQHLAGDRF
jgi:hypothetical protein